MSDAGAPLQPAKVKRQQAVVAAAAPNTQPLQPVKVKRQQQQQQQQQLEVPAVAAECSRLVAQRARRSLTDVNDRRGEADQQRRLRLDHGLDSVQSVVRQPNRAERRLIASQMASQAQSSSGSCSNSIKSMSADLKHQFLLLPPLHSSRAASLDMQRQMTDSAGRITLTEATEDERERQAVAAMFAKRPSTPASSSGAAAVVTSKEEEQQSEARDKLQPAKVKLSPRACAADGAEQDEIVQQLPRSPGPLQPAKVKRVRPLSPVTAERSLSKVREQRQERSRAPHLPTAPQRSKGLGMLQPAKVKRARPRSPVATARGSPRMETFVMVTESQRLCVTRKLTESNVALGTPISLRIRFPRRELALGPTLPPRSPYTVRQHCSAVDATSTVSPITLRMVFPALGVQRVECISLPYRDLVTDADMDDSHSSERKHSRRKRKRARTRRTRTMEATRIAKEEGPDSPSQAPGVFQGPTLPEAASASGSSTEMDRSKSPQQLQQMQQQQQRSPCKSDNASSECFSDETILL